MASDIQSAFAGGDFELGDSPAPQSQPEPTSEQASTLAVEARDATQVPAKEDKPQVDTKPKVQARDEQDEDDDGQDEGPPSLDGLQKALKSERSLKKQQRKELKEALSRLAQLEQQNQQMVMHLQRQQQVPTQPAPAQKTKDDDLLDRLLASKEPSKVIQEVIDARFAAEDQKRQAAETQAKQQRAFESRQKLLQERPEAQQLIDVVFRQLAQQDPRLEQMALESDDPARYAAEYAETVQRIQQHGSLSDFVEAEIKRRAAEQHPAAGGDVRANQGERRAPLTLANRRGSGGSVTPAQQNRTLDQIMTF